MKSTQATLSRILVVFLSCSTISSYCLGDEKPAKKQKESTKEVQKKPEIIELTGVFEAVQSTELTIDNEQLKELEIDRIVSHGTSVKSGQPVVWFATESLDKKLEEAETTFKLAKLDMESAEFDYEQFLETQELDRDAAKRKRDSARSDYDHFVKIQLERDIAGAQQSMKSAEFSVESSKEELEQLTQMYEEDDLTEASEEIVLRRAQFSYDSAMHRLTDAKIRIERTLKESIPRSELSKKETLDRALLTYDKTINDLDTQLSKRRLEIGRKRREFAAKESDFDTMQSERECVVIKAQHDGVVLHGSLTRGKVPAKPLKWDEGKKVSAGTTIATLANPVKLRVIVDLLEGQLAAVTKGKTMTVTPTGHPGTAFKGKVVSVASVPYVPGKFNCVISVPAKRTTGIMPTTTCTLKFEKDSK